MSGLQKGAGGQGPGAGAPLRGGGWGLGSGGWGAASDAGLVRDRNEDRYWADPEGSVFLVADGVGGHASGELSAQTVEVIRAAFVAMNWRRR